MEVQKSPQAATIEAVRTSPLGSLLNELLQGYRRPAVVVTQDGTMVHSNPAAMRLLAGEPEDRDVAPDHDVSIDPSLWLCRVAFEAHGLRLHLAVPDKATDDALPDPKHLPPRLAKIARLVVSGCTDKQIATQTGLSFSTVRTYVRQIYRRLNVHTRVELVHASLAEK